MTPGGPILPSVLHFLRRSPSDRGAAAVEFALLFPIFALLTFGMLSGGLMLWHTIATTQASRDAARLGSTTPLATATPALAGEYEVQAWLNHSMFVALQSAGWTPTSEANVALTDLNRSEEYGYACVAYVKGNDGTMTDKRLVVGTPEPGEPAAAGVQDGKCYDDGSSIASSRVQVMIHRRERLNLVVAAPQWTVYAKANVPYERALP